MTTNMVAGMNSLQPEEVEDASGQDHQEQGTYCLAGSMQLTEGSAATAMTPTERIPTSTNAQQTEVEDCNFTLFPKLPIELRFKIWKDAQPRGRVISLIFKQNAPDDSFALSSQPILLSVNQESRSETLKIFKLITASGEQDAPVSRRPIYIDPLTDCLLIADDWKTAPIDPDTVISLDHIVSWLSMDVIKSLKTLAIGLIIMETNTVARLSEPAFSALSKFSALNLVIAVMFPESRQRCATCLVDPYGLRKPTPPLLAPHEEAIFPVYLPREVQFAKPVAAGGNPLFAELDEILDLPPGVDRAQEIEDLMEELQDELDAVSLEHTKWKRPNLGLAAAE
ncbi:hypothetical protein BKA65DRAFT_533979 [Rhexocercosporidium sp. MPI-PUGE-AT-0058]|nr:hypothetical protein BKA65DRAFT_533979 [Rhexocercosporidium sp. MPI-PUGE-AT-0058]